MSKSTFRRIIAYIIDILIITLISSALARINFLNPYYDKYEETYEKYDNYILELTENPDMVNEIFSNEKLSSIAYDLSYYGIYTSMITLVITFLYFVLFQYSTKGKTAGKLIMGIEVVSKNGDDLSIKQLFIRGLIFNGLLTSLLLILMIMFLSKDTFINTSVFVEILDYGLIFACFGMVIYREDGIGLHDYFAKTIVIKSSEKELLYDKKKSKGKK